MTSIKITLPEVNASGRREGWWFHVTGLAASRKAGFGGFAGERLTAGECELPPMAVVLLLRPVGSARLDVRSADIMIVSPASHRLVGLAFGFDWEAGPSYDKLRMSVFGALQAQNSYNETDRKLEEMLTGWIGHGSTDEFRARAAAEIASILKTSVPNATNVRVVENEERRDMVNVEFTIPTKGATRLIKCAVPGYDGAGEPSFCFLYVRVPLDYEAVDEDFETPDTRHHAFVARRAADKDMGYDVAEDAPVYDDIDDRFEALLGMFYWESATVFSLEGGSE